MQLSLFISETVREIGPWLLRNTNMKSQVADYSVSVQMTVTALERQDLKSQTFPQHLRNLHCALAAAKCIVIGPVGLFICVCVFVGLLPR